MIAKQNYNRLRGNKRYKTAADEARGDANFETRHQKRIDTKQEASDQPDDSDKHAAVGDMQQVSEKERNAGWVHNAIVPVWR